MRVPRTLAEKILSLKSNSEAKAGDVVIADVDLAFVQDASGPLAIRQFRESGFKSLAKPQQTIIFLDHAVPSPAHQLFNDHILLRRFAAEAGCRVYDVGEGICHQLVAEAFANPGDIIVGADSHTVTAGALAAFRTGTGSGIDSDFKKVESARKLERLTYSNFPMNLSCTVPETRPNGTTT